MEAKTPIGAGPSFHPNTSFNRAATPKWHHQQGEQHPKALLPFHRNESDEGFYPEPRTPLHTFDIGSRHHHRSHPTEGRLCRITTRSHVSPPPSSRPGTTPPWHHVGAALHQGWKQHRPYHHGGAHRSSRWPAPPLCNSHRGVGQGIKSSTPVTTHLRKYHTIT
jgi:hypothetical protein